jgi:hypothetical protein
MTFPRSRSKCCDRWRPIYLTDGRIRVDRRAVGVLQLLRSMLLQKILSCFSRFWTIAPQLRFHKRDDFFFISNFIKVIIECLNGISLHQFGLFALMDLVNVQKRIGALRLKIWFGFGYLARIQSRLSRYHRLFASDIIEVPVETGFKFIFLIDLHEIGYQVDGNIAIIMVIAF